MPLGEDFLWRPHLLMYSFLLLVVIFALGGIYHVMRHGRGTMQQRFRADRVFGLLVLISGYMLFAVPADPVWHSVYATDISAWSIPHLVLGVSWLSIILLSPALLLSSLPERPWRGVYRMGALDLLMIGAFASMMNFLLQIMTTDWYSIQNGPSDWMLLRPDWLLTTVLVACAVFIGVLANNAMRFVGAATLVGLVATGLRVGLLLLFDNHPGAVADSWFVALVPLLAIDLWYAVHLRLRKSAPAWYSTGIIAGLSMVLTMPLVNTLFVYPQFTLSSVPLVLLTAVLAGVAMSWYSARLGDYLATANKAVEIAEQASAPATAPVLRWAVPLALVGVVGFIVYFIMTASPPV